MEQISFLAYLFLFKGDFMQNFNYKIEYAKEQDYENILNLIHKCFEKENGFFQKLVPVLYKEGKNAYKNHIIVKDNDMIIATIAIKEDTILIDDKSYKFLTLGSLGVDHNYRNQGIMGALFEFILTNYKDRVDFFVLSGLFERYKRFGFYPSTVLKQAVYNPSNSVKYIIEPFKEEDIEFAYNLYNKKNYKVVRETFFDSLNEWTFMPLMIRDNKKSLGYMIYNGVTSLVEEIVLTDYSIVNDVVSSFASMINNKVGLKITISNKELHSFINKDIVIEEYFEKTLYKIENENIKEIYIPKSDLI